LGRTRRYSFVGSRLKAAEERMRAELVAEIMVTGRSPLSCHAGRLSVVLSETGEVFPCEMIDKSFGNLRDYGYNLRRVLATENARDGLRRIDAACACTHECALMLNILFSPAAYPRLLRCLIGA
jgi:MoaA/NifB/PqqE/SkfB family radical SAM enzyme